MRLGLDPIHWVGLLGNRCVCICMMNLLHGVCMELGTSHMHFGPDLSVFDLIIDVGVYYGLLAYSFFVRCY